MQLVMIDLEKLRKLPRPWRCGPSRNRASVGSLEVTSIPRRMIEKGEAENNPPLLVNNGIATVADTRNKMQQAGAKLVFARPSGGIHRRIHRRIVFARRGGPWRSGGS